MSAEDDGDMAPLVEDIQLSRYLEAAPSAEVLDELERRVFRGFASALRQVRPGIYSYIEDSRGRLYATDGKPWLPR